MGARSLEVKHLTFNQGTEGSNPSVRTKRKYNRVVPFYGQVEGDDLILLENAKKKMQRAEAKLKRLRALRDIAIRHMVNKKKYTRASVARCLGLTTRSVIVIMHKGKKK